MRKNKNKSLLNSKIAAVLNILEIIVLVASIGLDITYIITENKTVGIFSIVTFVIWIGLAISYVVFNRRAKKEKNLVE